MTSTPPAEKPPRRLLICRLSAHGDTVQTLPLLAALKAAADTDGRALEVGWLVETAAAPLLENHPLITRLHVCPRKRWLQSLKNPLAWRQLLFEIREFVGAIKNQQYEASCDVQGLLKSAVWPWLAGIPRRLGNNKAREGASMFYTQKLAPHRFDPDTPAIDRYLEFATALGFPAKEIRFPLPPVKEGSRRKIETLLGDLGGKQIIVLAPATIWPTKHWPVAHWQKLIGELVKENVALIAIGTESDQKLVAEITGNYPVLNLAGKTELVDLYALFEKTDCFIGLDSAPLHIANAVADSNSESGGKPRIIGIFGPTSAKRTGPIGSQHQTASLALYCQPCFERNCPIKTHACMEDLKPEHVITLVRDHFKTGARA